MEKKIVIEENKGERQSVKITDLGTDDEQYADKQLDALSEDGESTTMTVRVPRSSNHAGLDAALIYKMHSEPYGEWKHLVTLPEGTDILDSDMWGYRKIANYFDCSVQNVRNHVKSYEKKIRKLSGSVSEKPKIPKPQKTSSRAKKELPEASRGIEDTEPQPEELDFEPVTKDEQIETPPTEDEQQDWDKINEDQPDAEVKNLPEEQTPMKEKKEKKVKKGKKNKKQK